jgi:hypothetical protein
VVIKKLAQIPKLKMFKERNDSRNLNKQLATISERNDSWYLKKQLAPIPNLKKFKERNDSWYLKNNQHQSLT